MGEVVAAFLHDSLHHAENVVLDFVRETEVREIEFGEFRRGSGLHRNSLSDIVNE